MKANEILQEDWKVLTSFFPKGWMAEAKKRGAFNRRKNIKSVRVLLRVLLIHIADGCSLRETVARAKQGGLCDISDVALLKRLQMSNEWLRWMSEEMLKKLGIEDSAPKWLRDYNVVSVDASVITEPGSTGTDWRLHYGFNLRGLRCEQFVITKPNIGESFKNFEVQEKDLMIGDRAYGRLAGLVHVVNNGGDYLARFKKDAFSMRKDGKEFDLINECKGLKYGEIGEWAVEGYTNGGLKQDMRVCVLKKSKQEIKVSVKKAKRIASKKQQKVTPETLEYCKYIILVTSLPESISAKQIAELYRYRWQVEIAFKRLKSILGLGHLPKSDEKSCIAWLHGKMFVALLAQAIVDEGRNFSPWGYPIK